MTQNEALNILKTGANTFLTGEPGSGKTHTVNTFVSWLREHDIEPAITASTGIAATHIGGLTIHAWSGIGIRHNLSPYDLDEITTNKRVVDRIQATRILIIDEVSMLSAQTLSMVHLVCREIRQSDQPFGGLQVVLVGDFFQLPPVHKSVDTHDPSLFEEKQGLFAFSAPIWKTLNPLVCYLSEQHRQEDPFFLDFLSAIRRGTVSSEHRKLLRTRYSRAPCDGITQLYSHNTDVSSINDKELAKLSSDEKVFQMTSKGPEKLVMALKRGCLSPEILSIKVGARVLFTKNDMEQKYVNGTLGTVTGFDTDTGYPIVKTKSGRTISTMPEEWHIEESGRILARITQVPLRLAWALTVHKSQGMSLDAAHMDLSKTFEYGQGYVALSRVRTLRGLTLAGLNDRALRVHPEIMSQDVTFRTEAESARHMFAKLSKEELTSMHTNFILTCGGTMDKILVRKEKKEKVGTLDATFALFKGGKTIQEIAAERSITVSTVFSHIYKLHTAKRIKAEEIEPHISSELKRALPVIHAAFKENGTEFLKPVFQKFEGKYSYNDLHFARMLIES